MTQATSLLPLGGPRVATNAAALAAPTYASATNKPFLATDGNRASRRVLLKLKGTGAGTGNIVMTVWYCDPKTQEVFIADDVALGGGWTVAYAGAAKNVAILIDTHGFDIGVSATVSAANITANIEATASELA